MSKRVLNLCSVEPVARKNRRTAPTLHLNQDHAWLQLHGVPHDSVPRSNEC
jgi:hypothetical protein